MNETYEVLNDTLVTIFNLILKSEEKFLKNIGCQLSISEIHTIEAIGKYEKRKMGNIAKDLNITLGTLTSSISNMEKKGYVNRLKSEKDRRIVYVSLTQKGQDVFVKHKMYHTKMINDVINDMGDEEEKVLIKALKNINTYFNNTYNSINSTRYGG